MDLLLPTITNGFLLPTGLVFKILPERHAIIISNNWIISTDTYYYLQKIYYYFKEIDITAH
jgi:hypothetical protein